MSSNIRILVKYLTNCEEPKLAEFSKCTLEHFGFTSGIGKVHVQLKDNYLILSDSQLTKDDQVLIKHPSFCPMCDLTPEQCKALPKETSTRGVDVGVAVVLESCDGQILLSRRAEHLRIFPGLWVPPGGHVESNESLLEAGFRELKEETGLSLTSKDCVDGKVNLLALWESVYPAKLTVGPPKRHHIVTYFHAKLVNGLTAALMEDRINFEPNEVGACAWLDHDIISAIVKSSEENDAETLASNIPETVRALCLNEQKEQTVTNIPTAPLLNVMGATDNAERVSTGTKFALEQLLKLQQLSK